MIPMDKDCLAEFIPEYEELNLQLIEAVCEMFKADQCRAQTVMRASAETAAMLNDLNQHQVTILTDRRVPLVDLSFEKTNARQLINDLAQPFDSALSAVVTATGQLLLCVRRMALVSPRRAAFIAGFSEEQCIELSKIGTREMLQFISTGGGAARINLTSRQMNQYFKSDYDSDVAAAMNVQNRVRKLRTRGETGLPVELCNAA